MADVTSVLTARLSDPAAREAAVVARTPKPRTRTTLAADLRALGVRDGDVVLAHTAVSALGWVAGREQAVILALLDAVGPTGTLVVPTQTGSNSDPAEWQGGAGGGGGGGGGRGAGRRCH